MADYTISLEITGKDDASPALGKVHGSLTGINKIASSALGAVGNGLKIIAGISLAGAVAGVGALVGELVSCAKAAMDAEEISAELMSVIKSTGGVAGVTADMANDLALSLSKVVRFEDDAIVQGESMLLTFTNIGKDVFPMATEAMLNMAQKFGSMDAASVQLGKALNDPIQGVSALRRVGVMLTDEQEKQIKQFMAVGDIASAQKVILKELETEFGGLARAAGETLAGKLDILKNRFGNVQETIGAAIIPLMTKLLDTIVIPLVPEIEKLAEGIVKLFDAMESGGMGGLATALGIPPEVQNTIANIIGTIERLFAATSKGGAGGLMEALNLPPGIVDAINQVLWSAILLGDWIQTNLPIAQAAFQTAWKVIGDVVMTVVDIFKADVLPALQEAFQSITEAMAELGIDWGDVWGAIGTALKLVAAIIGALLLFLVSLIVGFAKGWAATVKSVAKTIKEMAVNFKVMVEGIAKLFAGFMEVVKGIFSGDLPRVFRGVKLEIEGLVQFGSSMFKQLATVIGGFLDAIVKFVGEFVAGVVKFFQNLSDKLVGGSIIPEMMAAIKKVITDVLNAVRDFIQSILDTIAGIFQSVFARLVDIVSNALAAVQNAVTAGLNAIRSLFETGFANLVDIVSSAWTAILNGISTAWQAITDAINWAIQAIPAAVAQAIQGLVAIGMSIVTAIAQGITDAWNTAAGVVQNLYGLLMGLIGDVWKGDLPGTIVAFGETILGAISSGFTSAWTAVGGFVATVWELIAGLPEALNGAWIAVTGCGAAFVDALIQGVADNWQTFIDTIWQWIEDWLVPGSIPKILQKQVTGLRATGGMMADLMAQGFSARVGSLGLGMQLGNLGTSTANTNYYHNSNLYVTTVSPVENIVADFGMMDALAGVV